MHWQNLRIHHLTDTNIQFVFFRLVLEVSNEGQTEQKQKIPHNRYNFKFQSNNRRFVFYIKGRQTL